mgnify:CR=1 FL=1
MTYEVGNSKICFEDGNVVEWQDPKMEVGGVLYGEKVITMKDSLYIKDEMNSLYAEVVFNP